jgi:hypothetical protein
LRKSEGKRETGEHDNDVGRADAKAGLQRELMRTVVDRDLSSLVARNDDDQQDGDEGTAHFNHIGSVGKKREAETEERGEARAKRSDLKKKDEEERTYTVRP